MLTTVHALVGTTCTEPERRFATEFSGRPGKFHGSITTPRTSAATSIDAARLRRRFRHALKLVIAELHPDRRGARLDAAEVHEQLVRLHDWATR